MERLHILLWQVHKMTIANDDDEASHVVTLFALRTHMLAEYHNKNHLDTEAYPKSDSASLRYFIFENVEKTKLKLSIVPPREIDAKNEKQWRVQVSSTKVLIEFRFPDEVPEFSIAGDYQKWRLMSANVDQTPSWHNIEIALPVLVSTADAHVSREGIYTLFLQVVPSGFMKINNHY